MPIIADFHLLSTALFDSSTFSETITAYPDAAWGLLVMSIGLLIYAGCLSYRDKYLRS